MVRASKRSAHFYTGCRRDVPFQRSSGIVTGQRSVRPIRRIGDEVVDQMKLVTVVHTLQSTADERPIREMKTTRSLIVQSHSRNQVSQTDQTIQHARIGKRLDLCRIGFRKLTDEGL